MDQVPPITAPEPVIIPTPVPTPKSPILPIILAVLITSILFISGYFGYQYLTAPKTPAPIPTPVPSPASSTEVESNWKQDAPPEGWKTYTNHIRKYSISYPKDWFADTSLAETTLEDPSGATLVISRDNYKLTISWPSSYSPNECIFDDQTKAIEPQQVRCPGDFVSFGNHMRRLVNPTSNTWVIYSLQNPDSYVSVPPINYASPSKYDPKVLIEMDQILSTFKFNSVTNNESKSTKSYRFEPINLSLDVPLDLIVHTEEPNPGSFTAYIQNYPYNSPWPKEKAYQFYLTSQNDRTLSEAEFDNLDNDLLSTSMTKTLIDGRKTISGQTAGERNRYVVYILNNNKLITIFTAEPTKDNQEQTNQILSTFKFTNQ